MVKIPPLTKPSTDGKYIVVSGHQRLRAAKEIGIDLPCILRTDLNEEWKVEEQLIKDNLLRRHLNDYHKKKAVDRLIVIYETKAKEKQKLAGGDRRSTEHKQLNNVSLVSELTPVKKTETVKPKSRDQATKEVGMSVGQYVNATKVDNEATEPIRKKWQAGEITTGTAIAAIKKEEKKKQVEEKIKHTNEISNAIDHIKLSETTKLQCTTNVCVFLWV